MAPAVGVSQHLSPSSSPKDLVPVWLLAANRQRRYWVPKTASLFKAGRVTPQPAIHYHSNEPATKGGRTVQADFSPASPNYGGQLIGTVAPGVLTRGSHRALIQAECKQCINLLAWARQAGV